MNYMARRRRTTLMGDRRNQSPLRNAFTPPQMSPVDPANASPGSMNPQSQAMLNTMPVIGAGAGSKTIFNPLSGPENNAAPETPTYGIPTVNPGAPQAKKLMPSSGLSY